MLLFIVNQIKDLGFFNKSRTVLFIALPILLLIVQLLVFNFKIGALLTAFLILILIALLKPHILYLLVLSLFSIEGFEAVPGVSYTRIVAILLVLALALRTVLRKERIPNDDSYKYFILFFIGSLVSFAFANNISTSLTIYFTYISLFILYVLTRYFLQTTHDINRALNYIFFSTVIAFIIFFIFQPSPSKDLRVSGGIGDPNELASYILVLLPFTFYRIINSSGFLRISYWACLISFLLLLVYTQSRGGILGFLGMIGILIYYYGYGKIRQLFFLILIVATISYFSVPEDYWTRASTIIHNEEGKKEDESISNRLSFFQTAFKMFLDYPLAGVGLRNFQFHAREYGANRDNVVHNMYLEVLTGGGLLSFIPFSLIFINSWRKLRLRKNYDNNIRDLLICLKASFVSILITSFFLTAENKKILWFLLALISSAYYIARDQKALYNARNSQ